MTKQKSAFVCNDGATEHGFTRAIAPKAKTLKQVTKDMAASRLSKALAAL
tara:strand:+ start:159 stop:308 length:150 start_codon:yes stop_codon:yes gene_type:complete